MSDPLATLTPCALLSRNFRSYLGWSAAWSRPEAALVAGERAAPPEGGIPARAASTSARSDPRHCKRACSDRSRSIYGDIQSGGATAPPGESVLPEMGQIDRSMNDGAGNRALLPPIPCALPPLLLALSLVLLDGLGRLRLDRPPAQAAALRKGPGFRNPGCSQGSAWGNSHEGFPHQSRSSR